MGIRPVTKDGCHSQTCPIGERPANTPERRSTPRNRWPNSVSLDWYDTILRRGVSIVQNGHGEQPDRLCPMLYR